MIVKTYPVSFEVAGPAAMYARPDTGSSPVSYPVPTRTALKSMFEAVALSKEAFFHLLKIELCTPVVYHKYTTNYGGPLKESNEMNFQIFSTVLENVCYKVYGETKAYSSPRSGDNSQHMLQEVFLRRLKFGQFHSTPFLGWKEFVPTYFGDLRETTHVDESISITIPSMLDTMYNRPTDGRLAPAFRQDVRIEKGVMYYD
ncbi:MAG: CRISPR-associated protein Cas5 [Paenibacillaceae bacterium]